MLENGRGGGGLQRLQMTMMTKNNIITRGFDTIEENKVSSRMDLQILILQIRNAIAEFEICI